MNFSSILANREDTANIPKIRKCTTLSAPGGPDGTALPGVNNSRHAIVKAHTRVSQRKHGNHE
ncbi:hypothetical protein AWB96_16765 [Mycobacteroides chelonae]|nr:hypothetical protein BKG56_16520 [Mycobacteroides chelonae]ORV12998.1 hypothetical protein AWB96_16765 [Mycobacteroides chelonae]